MKTLLSIVLLNLTLLIYSQTIGITYSQEGSLTNRLYTKLIKDSVILEIKTNTLNNSKKNEKYWFRYYDMNNDLIYHFDGFGRKKHLIKDSLYPMDWEIFENKSKACLKNYTCYLATTIFRGRNYEVYFTPELPYTTGPWKLGGLPGLIVEAKTDDNMYNWQVISIKEYTVPPEIDKYVNNQLENNKAMPFEIFSSWMYDQLDYYYLKAKEMHSKSKYDSEKSGYLRPEKFHPDQE